MTLPIPRRQEEQSMTAGMDGPGMALKQFWDLIASSSRPTQDEYRRALQAELEKLELDDILAFHARLWGLLGQANQVDLWAAAYLIQGGCSDDGFLYFRCWVISRGRQVFESALAGPDSLVDVVDPAGRYNFELILSAPQQAWENRFVATYIDDEEPHQATSEANHSPVRLPSMKIDCPTFHEAYQRIDRTPYPALQGENFDFRDEVEMRRRFPRLAEVHLRR
jgi:hypothetical protein